MDKYNKRHGGPYDRGHADKYYGRGPSPHYYVGATYSSERVDRSNMTEAEIEAYMFGYNSCEDEKDWGDRD